MFNFAALICKQKEYRGSVYLDIYRALLYVIITTLSTSDAAEVLF